MALVDDARAGIERHVDGCDSCRRLVAGLMTPTAPPTFDERARAPEWPRSSRPLDEGSRIGRYTLAGYLGVGGMGIVYRAHDPELRRDLAVKLLRPDRQGHDGLAARLRLEAQAMAQIGHPNVIGIYDVGMWHDQVFIAMELATGGTLRTWRKTGRTPAQILEAYLAAGRGLAAAHAAGLVHRDFKPDNVLVAGDGRVRVTDFGLARSHGEPTAAGTPGTAQIGGGLTDTGAVVGTPGYMAPEIYRGGPCDARGDQFAFCVSLWEALYGSRPFVGDDEATVAAAVLRGAIEPPTAVRGVPSAVERTLRRGMLANPDERWLSIEVLLGELAPRAKTTRIVWLVGAIAVAGGITAAIALRPGSGEPAVAAKAPPVGVLGDPSQPGIADARTRLEHASIRFDSGDREGGIAEMGTVIAGLRAKHVDGVLAGALAMDGYARRMNQDLVGAERDLNEAIPLAEASGNTEAKAFAIGQLVTMLESEGKHEDASRWQQMAGAAASHSADPASRALALEAEAETLDVEPAIAKWNEAAAIYDANPKLDIARRTMNRCGLAGTLVQVNRLDEARVVLKDAAKTIDTRGGEPLVVARARLAIDLTLSIVDNFQERWADAEADARAALAVVESSPEISKAFAPLVRGYFYGRLGFALAGKRDMAGADAAFARALAETKNAQTIAQIHAWKSREALWQGNTTLAVSEANTAVETSEQALGADAALTVMMRGVSCTALVADHQLDRARPIAEKVVASLDASHVTSMQTADALYALARSIASTAPTRARSLADRADALAHAVGVDRSAIRAAIDRAMH